MSFLRDLRTKILADAEEAARTGRGPRNATPAGGTASSSAAGGSQRSQPKGPPPGQPKPPPPQPGRSESAEP
eukprot:4861139-Amphidinium_carterae.1